MKRVNFNPELELKKAKIMKQFDEGNGPELPPATDVAESDDLDLPGGT